MVSEFTSMSTCHIPSILLSFFCYFLSPVFSFDIPLWGLSLFSTVVFQAAKLSCHMCLLKERV